MCWSGRGVIPYAVLHAAPQIFTLLNSLFQHSYLGFVFALQIGRVFDSSRPARVGLAVRLALVWYIPLRAVLVALEAAWCWRQFTISGGSDRFEAGRHPGCF